MNKTASFRGPAGLAGPLEVIAAMTLAGSTVVVARALGGQLPIGLIGALSSAAAIAALAPFQLARLDELRRLRSADFFYMALQALFGIVLFRGFTLAGLRLTTAADAGVLLGAAPALLALAARIFLAERIGRRRLAGVAAAALAILLINAGGASAAGPGRPAMEPAQRLLGNACILAAAASEALLTIFRKKSGGAIGAVTNTTVLAGFSLVCFLPPAVFELAALNPAAVAPGAWLAVAYYGAVGTAAAYILWGDGALKVKASATGAAMAALPVSALLLAWFALGETPNPAQLIGCLLGMLGLLLGALEPRSAARP